MLIPPKFTREKFRVDARPLPATVAGHDLVATPAEMSTGSLGYRGSGRAKIVVGDCLVEVQLSVCVTIVHSKKL